MGLLDMFRRPPPVADAAALEEFIDQRAAFLTQKAAFEYSRARAGVMWQKLFKEVGFREAVDTSRWRSFPYAVGNVTEMVEGVLRPRASGRESELLASLTQVSRAVFHRYPVPAGEPARFWADAGEWLEGRLAPIQSAPPKPVKDIPLPTSREVFDLLPIHESLRGEDYPLMRNHLRTHLCRMYEDFVQRAELEALAADLLAPRPPVRLPGAGRR